MTRSTGIIRSGVGRWIEVCLLIPSQVGPETDYPFTVQSGDLVLVSGENGRSQVLIFPGYFLQTRS